MSTPRVVGLAMVVTAAGLASGQETRGTMTVNGQPGELRWAAALEVDSDSEHGYLDVVVVVADRALPEEVPGDDDRLQVLAVRDGLVALRVVLDPDARVKSPAPFHPSFTAFISSGASVEWQPSAFGQSTVAGRFSTGGEHRESGQPWSCDVTLSAPIALDPEARKVSEP